ITRDGPTPFVLFERSNVKASPQHTRERPHVHGCGWNVAFELTIPRDTPSGVYVFALIARDADRTFIANHFIVVRTERPTPGAIALVLCTSTYGAYNDWGGGNHYRSVHNGKATDHAEPMLSFERPWARGFAVLPKGAPRHSDG